MPRFLGKDYFQEDLTTRRELGARANFIVPRRFEDDDEQHTRHLIQDADGNLLQAFQNKLREFDVAENADSFPFEEACPETGRNVEPLEWATKWKEFEGNYVEIVPSSNPESHSSFCDSQPDSLQDFLQSGCAPEEFCKEPLGEVPKEEDPGYLEEPVTPPVHHESSPTLAVDGLLKTVSSHPNIVPISNSNHEGSVSERTVFGENDRRLQTTVNGEKTDLPDLPRLYREDFGKNHFEQPKAEELMCPMSCGDSPTCSPRLSQTEMVSKARSLCSEECTASPLPSSSEKCHADSGMTDVKDLVGEQEGVKDCLDELILSPVVKAKPANFVDLNATQDKEGNASVPKVLESPLYIHTASSSPLQFANSCRKSATSLEPWSPHLLCADSPLLNGQEADKLESAARQLEAAFGGIQSLKFREPEVGTQNKEPESLPEAITNALHLAKSVHSGGNLGRLELDLTWDVTSVTPNLPPLTCPEDLTVARAASEPRPVEWTASLDVETIEAIVERELAKKSSKDAEIETNTNNTRSLQTKSTQNDADGEDSFDCKMESGKKVKEGSCAREEVVCASQSSSARPLVPLVSVASNEFIEKNAVKSASSAPLGYLARDKRYAETDSSVHFNQEKLVRPVVTDNVSKQSYQLVNSAAQIPLRTSKHSYPQEKEILQNPTEEGQSPHHLSIELAKLCQRSQEKKHNTLLDTPVFLSTTIRNSSSSCPQSLQPPAEPVSTCDKLPPRDDNGDSSTNRDVGQPIKPRDRVVKHTAGHSLPGTEAEEPTPQGFRLQLDDEDIVLGSDFSSDQDKSPDMVDKPCSETAHGGAGNHSFDPVDHFLMLRDARTATSTLSSDVIKGHTVVKPVPRTQGRTNRHPGVITPMSVLPRSVGDNEQRFVSVSLSGHFLKALQEITSQADPHLQQLKTEGVVTPDSSFLSLRPDYIRYLLKDRAKKLEHVQQDECEDETYKHIVGIHVLRSAAHLLEHCCLESAIVHLSSMQDKYPAITGTVEGLRKALFQLQFTALQSGQLHPKVAAICREIQQHKHACPALRMLVVLRRDQVTLAKVLQAAISIDGTPTKTATAADGSWPEECDCLITWEQTIVNSLAPCCTLVMEFEADKDSSLSKTCQSEDISYVGLSTTETHCRQGQDKVSNTQPAYKVTPSDENCVTVVGSKELIQHQQLLQLLETRHNVMVMRRDYASIGLTHYPDVLVNVHRGAVLLHAEELREEGGLERLTEKLTALGLPLSTVWIIVHSLGDANRSLFERNTLKKLVQLQALIANLSAAAKGFTATYKILLCRTPGEVASNLAHLATSSDSSGGAGTGPMLGNLHLPSEITKEEKFLLGIPCLNSFSCHLILSRARLGEALSMSREQLHSLLPELTDSVFENLHRVVSMDRGLQLRPQQPYVHQSQSSHEWTTTEQPQSQHYSNSSQRAAQPYTDRAASSLRSADLGSPLLVGYGDRSEMTNDFDRQEARRTGLFPGEHSDFVSPEVSQQHYVVSSSSSGHHISDQPTPFLLPNAQQSDAERSKASVAGYYKRSETQQTVDDTAQSSVWQKTRMQDFEARSFYNTGNPSGHGTLRDGSEGRTLQNCSFVQGFPDEVDRWSQKQNYYRGQSSKQNYDANPKASSTDGSFQNEDSRFVSSSNWHQQSHQGTRLNRPLTDARNGDTGRALSHISDTLNHGMIEGRSEHLISQNDFPGSVQGLPSHSPQHSQHSSLFHSPQHDFNIPDEFRGVSKSCDGDPFWYEHPQYSKKGFGVVPSRGSSLNPDQRFEEYSAISETTRQQAKAKSLLPKKDWREDFNFSEHHDNNNKNSNILSDFLPSIPTRHETAGMPARRAGGDVYRSAEFGKDPTFASSQFVQPLPTSPISSYWRANQAGYERDRASDYRLSDVSNFSVESRDSHQRAAENSYSRCPAASEYRHDPAVADSRRGSASDRFADETSYHRMPSVPKSQSYGNSDNVNDTLLLSRSPSEVTRYQRPSGESSVYNRQSDGKELGPTERTQMSTDNFSTGSRPSFSSWYSNAEQIPPQVDRREDCEESRYSGSSFNDDLAATTRRLLAGRSRSPGFLYSSHRSQHHRPRTPTHRISIGLAQPLRREQQSQESQKAEGDNRLSQASSGRSLGPMTSSASPPLDIEGDTSPMAQSEGISAAAKLKKWSTQNQHRDAYSNKHREDMCPSTEKKRAVEDKKLTYRPVPGTGGQTKLTFQ
ncbi:uncharacterized protein [Littorina saxatilis]|uniref:Uncharacterized protein n=1 Tax=Littorina saxatilis TaxID=31220 RepID=A0AAN9G9G7_9CAEN